MNAAFISVTRRPRIPMPETRNSKYGKVTVPPLKQTGNGIYIGMQEYTYLFEELPHIQLTHAIWVDIPHRIELCFLNAQFYEF